MFIDPKFMAEQFKAEGKNPTLEIDKTVAILANLVDRSSLEISQMIGDKPNSHFIRIS